MFYIYIYIYILYLLILESGCSVEDVASTMLPDRVSHFFRELSGRAVSTDAVDQLPSRTLGQSQNRFKIGPGRLPGALKINQKSLRGPPGAPRGTREAPKSVLEHPRRAPGGPKGRPGSTRRLPKAAPGRRKGYPGAPGDASRRPKSTPSRLRERKSQLFFARLAREGLSE